MTAMKKINIRFKRRQKPYAYILPGDADTIRIEALGMGTVCACRDYPEMKKRAILETEARAALSLLRSKKPGYYCNDFEGLCRIYIPYYIGGFQTAMSRYQRDQTRYQENKAIIDEHGWIVALKAAEVNCAELLESIKEEMDAHPEWNQLT